jgi:hypothetical protein
VEQRLPFPVLVRPWDELPEPDRGFFCFADEYLPLHPSHAAQIGLLSPADAARVTEWAFAAVPPGWPDRTAARFEQEAERVVRDCWNDPVRRAEVRRWLFERGIPFRRTVYLLYDRERVVQTTWRMVVRYWDAFAWSVGYAMVSVDHTLGWVCCFHHEDVIVFGSHGKQAEPRAAADRGGGPGFPGSVPP